MDDFENYILSICPNNKSIKVINPKGISLFSESTKLNSIDICSNLLLVQRSHFFESLIVKWFLLKNSTLTNYSFKDYMIWSINN